MKRSAVALASIPARQILCGLFMMLALRCLLSAQHEGENSFPDEQILSEIGQHNELMTNIEYLSDVIGPRLTGSSQQRMASEWAEREFQQYGLTNVHQEKWMVARSWTRGPPRLGVIAPVSRRLIIVSAGWSPGTDGEVQGSVVYVSAKSPSELDKYKTKLSGAIVILEEPQSVTPPLKWAIPQCNSLFRHLMQSREADVSSARAFYETRTKFFEAQGVRAVSEIPQILSI